MYGYRMYLPAHWAFRPATYATMHTKTDLRSEVISTQFRQVFNDVYTVLELTVLCDIRLCE